MIVLCDATVRKTVESEPKIDGSGLRGAVPVALSRINFTVPYA